ncbi:MAG: ROK family protein [Polyangiaceae bacterium]|nr:ROK family protein [Polyangiaceae bacterium]
MTRDLRIGVDLGGTKTEAAVVRIAAATGPSVLSRTRIPTLRELGYASIIERTRDLIRSVAHDAGLSELPPIGISMPGGTTMLRPDGSPSDAPLVKNSNTTCLNGMPFFADLERAVGQSIVFANDANCFALAEATWGAARDARVAFGVILGTGVGGGIVLTDRDGVRRTWTGAQGIAGEWGHTVLDPDRGPPCYCGQRGCVETYLSGPAIERAYASRSGQTKNLAAIVADAHRGDHTSAALLEERLEIFGRALATVINVLDPDVVVLGGGASNISDFYDRGASAVARWVFNDTLRTRIVKHELGDSAGVLGATLL